MINEAQKEIVIHHLRPLRPYKIGIFGSYARNEEQPTSDLDILIYMNPDVRFSLLDLIGVEQQISDALGVKVDIVTERSLHPYMKLFVEKDVKIISDEK